MEPGFSLLQCPDSQLVSQGPKSCSREKISEFRFGRRHTTHNLVSTNACEYDPISLRGQAHPNLRVSTAIIAGSRHKTVPSRFGMLFGLGFEFWLLRTDVDVPTPATAFVFDFREIGAFVPVGFGVIVIRDCVEARSFGFAAGDDDVGHADD